MVIADATGRSVEGGERDFAEAVAVELRGVSRSYGSHMALTDVTLAVAAGEVRALLGPNGAGKTTMLRILAGLVDPTEGEVRLLGVPRALVPARRARQQVGLVPSGDRSFYLRLSGLDNLVFFGRLHGLPHTAALKRARECLEAVGLGEAERKWVGRYSHGMQKRLSVARALLMDPPVLLVDEATHDLDPDGARRVRDLVAACASRGAGVIWTTQRVEEIRGFAHRLTLLQRGRIRFDGTVPQFAGLSLARRYVVQTAPLATGGDALPALDAALDGIASVQATPDRSHYVVVLGDGVTIGSAIVALSRAGADVVACREERSELEQVFVELTGEGL
ncbi:MAG TPA: ABC transporter ATP-binding protein [Acidimicrobiales bacterium]|nr:ABC transporter ATP-binding protein [Acidimicrobiales bacterium]